MIFFYFLLLLFQIFVGKLIHTMCVSLKKGKEKKRRGGGKEHWEEVEDVGVRIRS